MDKMAVALWASLGANVGMICLVLIYKSIIKDALLDQKEYQRYILKMTDMLTPEQGEEMARYAELNLKFHSITKGTEWPTI